jgi:Cu/Ag efflux protein CusF
MRRLLIVLVALFAMAAFVSGVVAQEKKAEPPAPAVEKDKTEKAKASKPMKAYGTVVAYEVGKTIKVKGKKEKEWTFDIAPDAKIKGKVKEGGKVRVVYKKEGDKMVATSISVATAKKAKVVKK